MHSGPAANPLYACTADDALVASIAEVCLARTGSRRFVDFWLTHPCLLTYRSTTLTASSSRRLCVASFDAAERSAADRHCSHPSQAQDWVKKVSLFGLSLTEVGCR